MRVIGLSGWSGSGKTTLAEGVIPCLKAAGKTVSVIKHTHKSFSVDVPGKDSWRHSQAGATEVMLASHRRVAVFCEFETDQDFTVHELLAQMTNRGADHWLLVEGFRHSNLPRLEVWRAGLGKHPLYPDDPHVVAVASTDPAPVLTNLPWLDLNDPVQVAAFLLESAGRFDYMNPIEPMGLTFVTPESARGGFGPRRPQTWISGDHRNDSTGLRRE